MTISDAYRRFSGLSTQSITKPRAKQAATATLNSSSSISRTSISSSSPALKKISINWIMSLYLIIPICLAIQLCDQFLFQYALRSALPNSPEAYVLFKIFFGTPHIIASSVILMTNRDYLKTYRESILWFALLTSLGLGALYLFTNLIIIYVLVGAWTIIHVIRQQLGIGNVTYQLSGWLYKSWSWSILSTGVLMIILLYGRPMMSAELFSGLQMLMWLMVVSIFSLSIIAHRTISTPKGKVFLWSNSIMIILCAYFLTIRYDFFVIPIPRIIHDITAFSFYSFHDYNRHHQNPKNLIFTWTRKLRINPFWVCPLIAIGITAILRHIIDPVATDITQSVFGIPLPLFVSIAGALALLHYYTESFTWKKGSPYQRYIDIKT